jgi:CcmD family protein
VLVALSAGGLAAGSGAGPRHGVFDGCWNSIQGQSSAGKEFKVNGVKFLFAAYIATWVIHAFYLGTLVRRFSRLRQQLRELGKGK